MGRRIYDSGVVPRANGLHRQDACATSVDLTAVWINELDPVSSTGWIEQSSVQSTLRR